MGIFPLTSVIVGSGHSTLIGHDFFTCKAIDEVQYKSLTAPK